ncbi:major facilitator superfamily transporter 9 isoform X1 [Lycorma delicatula]|uniref:major facilitator superfamily transporter 9 isoform X1 n=2 Tax=Lycorma delicatula TaxID=130591 RepID=UPI003F5181DD
MVETAGDCTIDNGVRQMPWRLKFWEQRRHMVAVLAFFGFFNIYSLRVNLSIAIVAMNSVYDVTLSNGTVIKERDFDWDSKIQGLVLSSFFYGYIFTQLLGGWMGARYGGATVYVIGVFSTALLTLITPLLANISVYLLVVLRIIEGFFEGVTYPCIHAVWAKWAPISERSQMASLAFSGSFVGTVVVMPVCGLIAKYWGWAFVFYITGFVALIWCAIWWKLVENDPADDTSISPEELKYIQESMSTHQNSEIVHPWKKIATSMPVWAVVSAHFCENWGFYTLLTQLPTFMKDTLNFDLQSAGFASSLPYLVMAIIMQFAGRLADNLRNKNILSTTMVRKVFNCSAFISQTIFMVLAGYLLTPTGVIICLVLAVGLGAFAWPAFGVNHLDLAPQHASVLMGFSNTFATLPGIVSPLITGFVVTDKKASQWQVVFFIAGAIYLSGAIFYGTFASGELQEWAKEKPAEQIKLETTNKRSYDNKAIVNDV